MNAPAVACSIFDSNNLARLKLYGASCTRCSSIPRVGSPRCLSISNSRECGGTHDDTEGLVNLLLTVKDIVAVAFFKENGPGDWRVSMRSKRNIRQRHRPRVRRRRPHKTHPGAPRVVSLPT